MSTHLLPAEINDVERVARSHEALVLACERYLRPPAMLDNGDGTFSLVFDPDLTAGEQVTLDKILAGVRFTLMLGPDDFEVIRAEVPTLRAYYLNVAPTGAESVAAIKSIIRVLRALLRD